MAQEGIATVEQIAATMVKTDQALLVCPVRGPLNVTMLAKDGLTVSEEARRIDCIKYLLERGYPKNQIDVETVILKHLGESGRNTLRCDIIVYDDRVVELAHLPFDKRLNHALLVGEIKRDSSKKEGGVKFQLEPAMRQLARTDVLGVYWDDINRFLFTKSVKSDKGGQITEVVQDSLANLPKYGTTYKSKAIIFETLTPAENLVGILHGIANAMRSHGVNDEHTRYKETVKLLLARYCDEKEAAQSTSKELKLQVLKGVDPSFRDRVDEVYRVAGKRYSRAETLFSPSSVSELTDSALRAVVALIEGINLSSASTESMQQVFMSFVPAVFKKSLDQYFTPMTLIETMVEMAQIGPNDKIADPAMGTADFLASALEFRTRKGDADIVQRIFGIDKDPKAYDLAIINMILNRDGQTNLFRDDSIENHSLWEQEMDVLLCNPPFGAKTLEKNPNVLKHYDLGHVWAIDETSKKWVMTEEILGSQQLGILFIERCYKMLANNGRISIILPEGYLCTTLYGYVREWIVSHIQILNLTELPRRIFAKSDADLRSNILTGVKLPPAVLNEAIRNNYAIHTGLVRNVGFKMGGGFLPTYKRDEETGLEIRDAENHPVVSSDFNAITEDFLSFVRDGGDRTWNGAHIDDILSHSNLDMKPRRLMPRALKNIKSIQSLPHIRLGTIADVVKATVDLNETEPSKMWRLVEGLDIRAVEGVVVPQPLTKAWRIAERKSNKVYPLAKNDIIVGLVRPERRNIGFVINHDKDLVGSPDGVAVVRLRPEYENEYSQAWLFAILRSEQSRLQLWTESGGTSYGKLSAEHIENVLIKKPSKTELATVTNQIMSWSSNLEAGFREWATIGSDEDRAPIVNSAITGLGEE
ncbi:MAG: hypothetical protein JWN01_821 [Patescibacteria group bacterium]|nr:hypothetical protein [Patescibacteria group bacterium]